MVRIAISKEIVPEASGSCENIVRLIDWKIPVVAVRSTGKFRWLPGVRLSRPQEPDSPYTANTSPTTTRGDLWSRSKLFLRSLPVTFDHRAIESRVHTVRIKFKMYSFGYKGVDFLRFQRNSSERFHVSPSGFKEEERDDHSRLPGGINYSNVDRSGRWTVDDRACEC